MIQLRPQDVVVALYLSLVPESPFVALAEGVALSLGESHNAVRRLRAARLLRADARAVHRRSLLEFLAYGVAYVWPTEPGPQVRGVPTAHGVGALAEEFRDAPPYVWPSFDGTIVGHAVEPLHASVPGVALRDPRLHELLALVDAIRVGRARERERARGLLADRLGARVVRGERE